MNKYTLEITTPHGTHTATYEAYTAELAIVEAETDHDGATVQVISE